MDIIKNQRCTCIRMFSIPDPDEFLANLHREACAEPLENFQEPLVTMKELMCAFTVGFHENVPEDNAWMAFHHDLLKYRMQNPILDPFKYCSTCLGFESTQTAKETDCTEECDGIKKEVTGKKSGHKRKKTKMNHIRHEEQRLKDDQFSKDYRDYDGMQTKRDTNEGELDDFERMLALAQQQSGK